VKSIVVKWLKRFFKLSKPKSMVIWQDSWRAILQERVSFYQRLSEQEQGEFEKRVLLFLQTTTVESGQLDVSDTDRMLVAASAVIPVWGFPKWHYINLATVYLLPAAFNDDFECGKSDSRYTGMVGSGPMAGKMALSQPALHYGFANDRDKSNVGVHEFIHLIDMEDGQTDGFPERLKDHSYALPWFELVEKKTRDIIKRRSNIDNYAATNSVEFLAVTSEYFFERPKMLEKKHPQLYQALEDFYQLSVEEISGDLEWRRTHPCNCNSGKIYSDCCLPKD